MAIKINSKKHGRILTHLMAQFNCKCHWCDCEVFRGKLYRNQTNQATIDHLLTKRMGRTTYMEGGHVLACNLCNEARNILENRILCRSKIDIELPINGPFEWCVQSLINYTGRHIL